MWKYARVTLPIIALLAVLVVLMHISGKMEQAALEKAEILECRP